MTTESNSLSPAINQAMDLFHKLLSPATEQFGLLLGEKARGYRERKLVEVLLKTDRKLADAKRQPRPVPPRFLLPFVDGCSVENDETLQDKWAGLLATASQEGDSISPSFIETLKQLTPEDARILDRIYDKALKDRERMLSTLAKEIRQRVPPSRPRWITVQPRELSGPARTSADTFERLGLLQKSYDVKNEVVTASGTDSVEDVRSEIVYTYVLNEYAQRFLDACRGPLPEGVK